nr:MAG TPA: hypothetical protein [Caudoviricetes sp.]
MNFYKKRLDKIPTSKFLVFVIKVEYNKICLMAL